MIHDAGRETKQMQNFLANVIIHHVLFISTGEKCSLIIENLQVIWRKSGKHICTISSGKQSEHIKPGKYIFFQLIATSGGVSIVLLNLKEGVSCSSERYCSDTLLCVCRRSIILALGQLCF
jgi:hypothetical protein